MESDDGCHLDYEVWDGKRKFWQHALCGSAAGVMEHLALFPLDTLKTRLQCGWCHRRSHACPPPLESVRRISTLALPKSQLYRDLFRGCNVIAAGCVPAHIMYFSVYEIVKRAGGVATAGAMATLCHDLVLTPADVIKQRLQLGSYRDTLHCLRQVTRKEGVRSLFRSLPVTLFMNVPYHALLVSVNEFLMRVRPVPEDGRGIYTYFLYAGVGGAVAGALTNPIDVIKTRLQTQDCHLSRTGQCEPLYTNPVDTARAVYRNYGVRGFWRGTLTRVGICVPAAAICWGTYASLKKLLSRFNDA